MSFTIKPDGSITVDTADELRAVLTVRRQLSSPAQAPSPSVPPVPVVQLDQRPAAAAEPVNQSQGNREEAYRRFFDEMSDHPEQQELLRVLLRAAPHKVSDDELRTALRLQTNVALRGPLIGIVRRANNRGLEGPVRTDVTRSDGGRKRHYEYTVSPAFRRAMEGYRFEPLLETA